MQKIIKGILQLIILLLFYPGRGNQRNYHSPKELNADRKIWINTLHFMI